MFTRGLDLPRERDREIVHDSRDREYTLRGSESRTLATVGAFRVVPTRDLRDRDDRPADPRNGDLRHLREQGLIETVRIPGYRDQAVVLTERGRDLLEANRDRDRDSGQSFYAGVGRERELEHDSQVYRAYERDAAKLQAQGMELERVRLEAELKREYQQWLHERDRDRPDATGRPDRDPREIEQWAHEHDLPYRDGHVQFPDCQIEYRDIDGREDHLNVEVTTEHYRGSHGAAVASSGFSCHRGSSARVGGRGGGGNPDSRYRRAVPARQVRHRLMRLDAALISPDLDWLTTRTEKLAWLATHRPVEGAVSPADSLPDHSDLLPGTFPMGMDGTGRLVIIYIVTVPWTDDFRLFLKGHEVVLAAAPAWTLRVVLPTSLQRVADDYTRAMHEELESPLADPGEVGWFFFHRRRGTDWRDYIKPGSEALKSKAVRCLTAYTGPRFTLLYRRWLVEGEAALRPISPRIREALAAGRAGLECIVLPYDYEPFSPLVSRRREPRRLHTEEDDEVNMGVT